MNRRNLAETPISGQQRTVQPLGEGDVRSVVRGEVVSKLPHPIEDPDDLRALVAELRDEYRAYLDAADTLADGPSLRIADAALRDKERQVEALARIALGTDDPARDERYLPSSFD